MSGHSTKTAQRAAVIVSGGDAVTPFTTPDLACGVGLSAGNTCTALRDAMLTAGIPVYTAPAMNARGVVVEPDPDSFGAFGECPVVLPAHMTILSTGDIDNAGEHLARFIGYLHEHYGVTEIDWIGHSNGGLFARAATRILQETGHPVAVRSLTTLATPWMGANPLRIMAGEVDRSECRGQASCLALVDGLEADADRFLGLESQNTYRYLMGEHGWNQAQAGVLDGIPTFLIGGAALTAGGGDPEFWPNDGLVSEYSALATGVGDDVVPIRVTASFPLLHSIFIADALGEDWSMGLTWNAEVLDAVTAFVREQRGRHR